MNTGTYSLIDLLEFNNLDQFIVPEIQRDYVWGTSEIKDFLDSIYEYFENQNKNDKPYLGFIYAYTEKDYPYKYFLVDGQQRMTTIFLLFLGSYMKASQEFPDYLVKNGKLKLDYKVRQSTHDFLTDLVDHCQRNPKDIGFKIKDQVWFHKNYETDTTISNIVNSYNFIRRWLLDFDQPRIKEFIKFLESHVELSYFDVENGRQGEDLYLYMNSRGLQLEPNETIKARFLSPIADNGEKEKWGHIWETWQDFFWKHKGASSDADDGFNDFLRMVQVINMCRTGKTADEISRFASGRSDQNIDINQLPGSLNEIQKYFQSLEYLTRSERVKDFFLKYEETEDYFSASSSIELSRRQIYYLRTLPVMALLTMLNNTGDINEESLIRFVRFFYNVSRKRSSVGKDIANQLPIAIRLMIEYGTSKKKDHDVLDLIEYSKGRSVLINQEEVLKLNLYKNPPSDSTRSSLRSYFGKPKITPYSMVRSAFC